MSRGFSDGCGIEQGRVRLLYLDWLRVLAMVSVFLYHADRFFTFEGWHVQNATSSLASQIHTDFFGQWMMPFFFILSGASIVFALQRRSGWQFIRERLLRLMLPLVTLGWFILGPPQIWLDRLTNGAFTGTFWQFYSVYFEGVDQFGGNFAWHGVHMWYLLYLFVISLLWLPFFLPLKKSGVGLLAKAAPLFEQPWALYLLALPVSGMRFLVDVLDVGFMRGTGGWSLLSYIVFLPIGYLLFCTEKTREAVRRVTWISLILAIGLSTFGLLMDYVWHPSIGYLSISHYGVRLVDSLQAICWGLAFIGLGQRFLNFRNRFVRYGNEAVLPFYILHQFVMLLVGYYGVMRWDLPIFPKYLLVLVLSFVGIMLPYEFLIRRLNPLRVLFGMRAHRKIR